MPLSRFSPPPLFAGGKKKPLKQPKKQTKDLDEVGRWGGRGEHLSSERAPAAPRRAWDAGTGTEAAGDPLGKYVGDGPEAPAADPRA